MASFKYDQIPIPGLCEYISLQGTKDCGAVVKLRIPRWGDHPRLSGWISVLITDVHEREEDQSLRKGDTIMKPERRERWRDLKIFHH